jgi:hypothetical protein
VVAPAVDALLLAREVARALGGRLDKVLVVAAVRGEAAVVEVDDVGADGREEVAGVADHEERAVPFRGAARGAAAVRSAGGRLATPSSSLVARQVVLEPQHGVQVEVVGRLVQQQEVRLHVQRAREGHAHAPPAGQRARRAAHHRVVEREAAQQGHRARLGAVGVDLLQALPHGRQAGGGGVGRRGSRRGCCGLVAAAPLAAAAAAAAALCAARPLHLGLERPLLLEQRRALRVARDDGVERGPLVPGHLLLHVQDLVPLGDALDVPVRQRAQQRRLAGPVAADEAVAPPAREGELPVLDEVLAAVGDAEALEAQVARARDPPPAPHLEQLRGGRHPLLALAEVGLGGCAARRLLLGLPPLELLAVALARQRQLLHHQVAAALEVGAQEAPRAHGRAAAAAAAAAVGRAAAAAAAAGRRRAAVRGHKQRVAERDGPPRRQGPRGRLVRGLGRRARRVAAPRPAAPAPQRPEALREGAARVAAGAVVGAQAAVEQDGADLFVVAVAAAAAAAGPGLKVRVGQDRHDVVEDVRVGLWRRLEDVAHGRAHRGLEEVGGVRHCLFVCFLFLCVQPPSALLGLAGGGGALGRTSANPVAPATLSRRLRPLRRRCSMRRVSERGIDARLASSSARAYARTAACSSLQGRRFAARRAARKSERTCFWMPLLLDMKGVCCAKWFDRWWLAL